MTMTGAVSPSSLPRFARSLLEGGSERPAPPQISSEVTVNGIEVSISYPPSAGFSTVNGNTAVYSDTFFDVWSASHYYDGFHASSYFALYDAQQHDSSTFTFGTDAYTLFTDTAIF